MLNESQAIDVIRSTFPDSNASKYIEYDDVYLFQVISDDPIEGGQDPFFSVNKNTGEVRDFSVLTDGNISEIAEKFLARYGDG